MLRTLDAPDVEGQQGAWLQQYVGDFRARCWAQAPVSLHLQSNVGLHQHLLKLWRGSSSAPRGGGPDAAEWSASRCMCRSQHDVGGVPALLSLTARPRIPHQNKIVETECSCRLSMQHTTTYHCSHVHQRLSACMQIAGHAAWASDVDTPGSCHLQRK